MPGKRILNTPDEILLRQPKWTPADLGAPLPASPHANSVCLPEWRDIVDYEEKRPRVMERLQAGYPRFVVPPPCARFFELCRERLARGDERCHAYPTERAARRCADMIRAWSRAEARVAPWGDTGVHVVCYPAAAEEWALKYWRHTGEGISSRRAEALVSGAREADGTAAKQQVRARIAAHTGARPECVYLFKSGMAAIYTLYRAVTRMSPDPDGTCVQFGFPYVDTLKIQQDFGGHSAFLPFGNRADLDRLRLLLQAEDVSALFCEFPSNPLLVSPDLAALSALGRKHGFPVIVDDTIATWANVDLLPAADVLVTSLTKYFTGRGDVMAGAVVLNPDGHLYGDLRAALEHEYEDCVWGDNALLIEQYAADFPERMVRINRTAEAVCDWLQARPEVADVYYPKFHTRECYDAFRRKGGGYSGLFSILLKDAPATSAPFYDRLECCKGPNLGTTFSLCCPFTLLAHYGELDWAERCGVSRWLLRFSIGLEEPADLIDRLERAFTALRA